MRLNLYLIGCLLGLGFTARLHAQTRPLVERWLWPHYQLERNAAVRPAFPGATSPSQGPSLEYQSDPLLLEGMAPTHRLKNMLPPDSLPRKAFTAELWVMDHVDQPIGVLCALKSKSKLQPVSWYLGYYRHQVIGELHTVQPVNHFRIARKIGSGFKKYFYHLVLSYTGSRMAIFVNGKEEWAQDMEGELRWPELPELEISAYLQHEPYMDLGNILPFFRIWEVGTTEEAIRARYNLLKSLAESGQLQFQDFHLNAGPYLHFPTQESVNLIFETDRPSTGYVQYGDNLNMEQRINLNTPATIHELTLDGLSSGTPYYYQVHLKGPKEEKLSSSILTFAPAVDDSAAYSFAVYGDTEARPHINDRMAKWIWEERPNFMINLGDLTDGGQEEHKFEWNYEYFQGMTQLNSRIPVFPVPGNGESDLYWYKRYHKLPGNEAFYSFKYGNAEFFMLNSNDKEALKPGGEQFEWLKTQLANSTAKWKFACHHHPAFTSDENDYGNTWLGKGSQLGDMFVRELVQLYEEYQVDMVMYGHLHVYERTWPLHNMKVTPEAGVVYLVAGGAGGNLEDFAPTRSWFSTKLYRGHHYCKIDIHGGDLFFKMYDLQGALKDYMEIHKD